jgi:hypothetical protein
MLLGPVFLWPPVDECEQSCCRSSMPVVGVGHQRTGELIPSTGIAATAEALVQGLPLAAELGWVAPKGAGAQNPQQRWIIPRPTKPERQPSRARLLNTRPSRYLRPLRRYSDPLALQKWLSLNQHSTDLGILKVNPVRALSHLSLQTAARGFGIAVNCAKVPHAARLP